MVIIVKNLPSGTTTIELKSLFERHGVVKSVLFPPAGITAIVEMEEPSEARAAFKRLAYSKVDVVCSNNQMLLISASTT